MTDEDRALPAPMREAHTRGFCRDHDGRNLQPAEAFLWSGEVLDWWQAWTGDPAAGAPPFRVFGEDGSGGLAAFWLRDPAAAPEAQPVVFLGSEGELAVIARDLGDYLWLLAAGADPLETVDGLDRPLEPDPGLAAIARRHTGTAPRSVAEILAAARAELPALTALIDASVR